MSQSEFSKRFRHYEVAKDRDVQNLWKHSAIVLDTNVIGRLYRVGATGRDALLSNLSDLRTRLWMPHQVGVEYHRNRASFRKDAQAAVRASAQKLTNIIAEFEKEIAYARSNYVELQVDDEVANVVGHIRDIARTIKESASESAPDEIDKTIYEALSDIYVDGKIGMPYRGKELDRHREAGFARFARSIPPGYRDAPRKTGDQALGDYFIWAQLLDYCTRTKKNVIFVTDDTKSDWYDGAKNTWRSELYQEFAHVTGKRILFLTSEQFITSSSDALDRDKEAAALAAAEFRRTTSATTQDYLNNLGFTQHEFDTAVRRSTWSPISPKDLIGGGSLSDMFAPGLWRDALGENSPHSLVRSASEETFSHFWGQQLRDVLRSAADDQNDSEGPEESEHEAPHVSEPEPPHEPEAPDEPEPQEPEPPHEPESPYEQ